MRKLPAGKAQCGSYAMTTKTANVAPGPYGYYVIPFCTHFSRLELHPKEKQPNCHRPMGGDHSAA